MPTHNWAGLMFFLPWLAEDTRLVPETSRCRVFDDPCINIDRTRCRERYHLSRNAGKGGPRPYDNTIPSQLINLL
ncbi:hypothetical protein V8C42DRAFT_51128 [Trichoderma barbatum]